MNTPNEMGFPKLRNVIISINYYTQNFPFVKLISELRVEKGFVMKTTCFSPSFWFAFD